MTTETSRTVKLELNNDEAVVLFEWLAHVEEQDLLNGDDPAAEQVLWRLHAQLESVLVEPFRADYGEVLARARMRLRKR